MQTYRIHDLPHIRGDVMDATALYDTPTPDPEPVSEAPTASAEMVLLQLLDTLDDVESEHQLMQQTLNAVTRVIPCSQAVLYEWDEEAGQPQLCYSAATEPGFLTEYLARFRSIDPFATEAVQMRAIKSGRSLLSTDVLSQEALMRTPFYQRFLSRHGQLCHGLGLYAPSYGFFRVRLWLYRSAGEAAFSAAERATLDLFMLHVAAKVRQRRALQRTERERDALRACMDTWTQPVFVLDAHAHLISCNSAAAALLRDGRRLSLRGGRLYPGRLMDHASWLPEALESVLARTRSPHQPATHLEPLPLKRAGAALNFGLLSALGSARQAGHGAAALLMMIDLQQAVPRHKVNELTRVFGFTQTEARVANALVAGLGTDDISQAFLIRRDTVRTHIKRLLGKTGTHSHAEFQKLLLRLSPPLVGLNQKPE